MPCVGIGTRTSAHPLNCHAVASSWSAAAARASANALSPATSASRSVFLQGQLLQGSSSRDPMHPLSSWEAMRWRQEHRARVFFSS